MMIRRLSLIGLACVLTTAGCAQRASEAPPIAGHFSVRTDVAARQQYQRLLDQVAAEPGALRTNSGLVYIASSPPAAAPGRGDRTPSRCAIR